MSGGIVGNISSYTDNTELTKKIEHLGSVLKEGLIGKNASDSQTTQILNTLKIVIEKLEKMETMQRKIASTVSQLHDSGQMNDEVFQTLKEYFKPYYDDPYKQDNY